MSYQTALVTGGCGFIGSHLVDALVVAGKTVVIVDKDAPNPKWKNDAATYVTFDIRNEGLAEALAFTKPDVMFHLAAHIDDRASVKNPMMNAEHNVLGTIRVLDAIRAANPSCAVVFASSCAVYGKNASVLTQDETPVAPLTPYGISKYGGEMYGAFFASSCPMTFCALRFSNVYGPRQDGSREAGAIAIFTAKLLLGESPFLNNDGRTTRDYVYVADVVDACMCAAERRATRTYNIGTGVKRETRAVFDAIAQALGSSIAPTPRPDAADAVKHIALDASKAERELGWKPIMGFAEGVQKTVEFYVR